MGGETNATTNPQANQLSQLFGASQGYQQQPGQPIQAPQYPAAATSPEDAAKATVARMLARTPTQPAPVIQKPVTPPKVPYRDIR